jgi:hypothetical protein
MRSLLLLGLGVVIGAMVATIIANTLSRRDAYARGVMAVLQQHYGSLREGVRHGRCDRDLAPTRSLLATLSGELAPAVYGDSTPDAPFREYVQRLRDAVAALPDRATGCPALAPQLNRIGDACDACHRQYR